MYANYLKTALRNLMRQKLFSFINIFGLAIGLAACALILLFVRDEFSWDGHWQRGSDIYKVETTLQYPVGSDRLSPFAPSPLKDILKSTFAEVEEVTRYMSGGVSARRGEDLLIQQALLADDNFFEFFDFDFIEGSMASAFTSVTSLVISERTAVAYFGEEPAMGQVVSVRVGGEFRDFVVRGVIADPVQNTHIQHDFIIPFNDEYFAGARWFTEDWRFLYRATYVRFRPETNIDLMRIALPGLVAQHRPTSSQDSGQESAPGVVLHLVAMGDVHLYSHAASSDPEVLLGFVALAFLILLIAMANFLNLSMARTTHRAREVAVRKVVGASRMQVAQQFLGESVLLVFFALLVALTIVEFSLPYYNEFLTAVVELNLMSGPMVLLSAVLLVVGVGAFAGSFQAAYFAILKPKDVLYSNMAPDHSTGKLRTVLVLAQFTISIALMVGAFFVNRQTEYARGLDLGFNPENLLVVAGTNSDQSDAFKRRLLEQPDIVSVGRSSDVPTRGSEDRLRMRSTTSGDLVTLDGLPTDADFFRVFEIPLLAGRYLTDQEADILRGRDEGDTYKGAANVVINRSGAELLGFPEPTAALGQTIPTDLTPTQRLDATIVGVVDDFHFDSAHDVIRPGIYYLDAQRLAEMTVRLDGLRYDDGIAALAEAWRETFPDSVLTYRTMSDLVAEQYQSEARLSDMLMAFTVLAVSISCLGLYGLASFAVERRTKEIGIRKVMGARYLDVALMLIWQFSKPIFGAVLLAVPIALYLVSDWLEGFAYRISIEALPFVLVCAAAIAIGWVTVASHAFRVARANPIDALRYE